MLIDEDESPGPGLVSGLIHRVMMENTVSERSVRAFPVSLIRTSVEDATLAILAKNEMLLKKNRESGLALVNLTGNENARVIEETFIDNYLRVMGNAHCQGAVSLVQILNHLVGWQTGLEFCLKVDAFVTRLAQRMLSSMVDAYIEHIKPEDVAFDCAKIVLSRTTKTRTCVNLAISHTVEILGDMSGGGIMSYVLKFVGDFLLNSTSMLVTMTSSPTCDYMLEEAVPVSVFPFSNLAVDTVKRMASRSIESHRSKKNTTAQTGRKSAGQKSGKRIDDTEPTFGDDEPEPPKQKPDQKPAPEDIDPFGAVN